MKISNYSDLIRNLQIENQAFKTRYKIWNKSIGIDPPGEIAEIFAGREEIKISRKDILNESNLVKKIYMTIFWGYPRGMRNNYHKSIFNQIAGIVDLLNKSQNIINWNQQTKNEGFFGLGFSTYSKLLYFNNSKIENLKALILDRRIIDCFRNNEFEEFDTLKTNISNNAKKYYSNYLLTMNRIAQQNNVTEEQIELFLFLFGNNLKQG